MARRRSLRIPTSTHLHVVDDASDRLVVHIPGGGPQAAGLGCFVLFWNAILVCITAALFFIGVQEGAKDGDNPLWFFALLLLVFWAIGLGLTWLWARMRFTRYNLLVEPDRVVLQKSFGRSKSIEETGMDADSAVALVESYQQNDVPVHAISVRGVDRTLRFGTALSEQDKRYLARKIRLVTGLERRPEHGAAVREFPSHCEACGAPLPEPEADALTVACAHCGSVYTGAEVTPGTAWEDSLPFEDIAPSDLPPGSIFEVDDSRPDRLELRYPAFISTSRWGVAGCAAVASVFVAAFLAGVFNMLLALIGDNLLALHIAGTVLLVVGVPVLFTAACLRSTCLVVVDREHLRATWKLGPLKFRREAPVREIRQIVLTQTPDENGPEHGSRRSGRGSFQDHVTCLVVSDALRIPLTSTHDLASVRQLAGIVRGRLRKMGCRVS